MRIFNNPRSMFAVLCLQVVAFLVWSLHLIEVDTGSRVVQAPWTETSIVQRTSVTNSQGLVSAVAKAIIESNVTNKKSSSVNATTRPLLRVYVYENLPSEFTTDIEDFIQKRKYHTMAKEDNFGADIPIINLFRNYEGRTYDPTQADLFLVPYPHRSHCLKQLFLSRNKKGNARRCSVIPEDTIHRLLASLSYFNVTTIKKHLFILSGDTRLCNQRLEEMPLTLTLGPVPEVQSGNIVIPYLNNRPEYQPSIIYQRDRDWWTRPRKYSFAYFFGSASPLMKGRRLRSVFVRQVNQTYGASVGGLPFMMTPMIKWSPENKDEAFETYRESLFCPCLPGDFPAQKRFFDAIMSGCLPVVVSFQKSGYPGRKSWFRKDYPSVEASYPFAKGMFDGGIEIDYESFVVQAQNVRDIKPTMEAIMADPDDLHRRQRNLRKYAPLVSYDLDAKSHVENAFTQILKVLKHYLDFPPESRGISRSSLPDGPKTHPRPQLTDRLLGKFIVVPEYNLLFCYVEKVGCSMFNHLFRMLRLYHPDVAQNPAEVAHLANFTWYRNTPKHHKLTKSDLEDILVNPNWTKAVFYRDPLMRFLSAFRNKCENTLANSTTYYCKTFTSPGSNSPNFDSVITQIENGRFEHLDNPHFAFASDFCGGLNSTIEYYDVVHELNSETPVYVETLLDKIGVAPGLVRNLVDNIVRSKATNTVEDRKRALELGVKLVFGQWHDRSHSTDTSKATCDYFTTRDKIKLIEELYSVDYKTFEFAPPDLKCILPNKKK